MPNYEVGYFLDVVQIVGKVLRKCSNLIVKVCLTMIFLCIERQDYLENLKGQCVGDI